MEVKFVMKGFVAENRNLFEKVANSYDKAKDFTQKTYTIMDYEKMFDEIIEFIEGYESYSKDGSNKYEGRVLKSTKHFYDNMFNDNKHYRIKFNLRDFNRMNKVYLEKTKQLEETLQHFAKDNNPEMRAIIAITNNQYNKIGKVYKDDMKIYLWLISENSTFMKYSISDDLRRIYNNKETPVIHLYDKNDWRDDVS